MPWGTAIVVLLAMAVQTWSRAHSSLVLERAAVLAGEVWRLWTAHVTHFGANHLAWNLAVIALAGAWAERMAPWRTRLFYLFAPAIISAVLLWCDAALERYAGGSGLASGLVALLALTGLTRGAPRDRWFWIAVLGLLAGKVIWEFVGRRNAFVTFSDQEIMPVPLAHLVGIFCGAAVQLWREDDPDAGQAVKSE